MALVPRRPFEEFSNLFNDDDWFLPVFSKRGQEPDMDVYETEKDVVAEVSIPDMNIEDVKVSVDNGVLRVSGEKEETEEDKEKNYWKKEIRKGSFERMIRLPAKVDEEKAEANYEKGVLRVVLPKADPDKGEGKEIKIKAD